MLHNASDSYGPPSWEPAMTTMTRNLLINSYGAGHGIDHDDGENGAGCALICLRAINCLSREDALVLCSPGANCTCSALLC
jgi:hypothetical protein